MDNSDRRRNILDALRAVGIGLAAVLVAMVVGDAQTHTVRFIIFVVVYVSAGAVGGFTIRQYWWQISALIVLPQILITLPNLFFPERIALVVAGWIIAFSSAALGSRAANNALWAILRNRFRSKAS